jgi:phosphocarrier protein
MVIKEVTVLNETGIHARPASEFVKAAGGFESKIDVITEEKSINAKSIMGILAGGISQGTTIKIKAEGADEDNAVDTLVKMINSTFPA